MLTIEALKAFGADTDDGLKRCLNKEDFYFKLIGIAVNDGNFEKLGEAIEKGDLAAAFDSAHALKGVLGNLALTPILKPVAEATELLRSGTQTDYSGYIAEITAKRNELKALCEE